jgi:hypothetical protein
VLSGTRYTGFNAFAGYTVICTSEPQVIKTRKVYGSPVPDNVINNPDMVTLEFGVETVTVSTTSSGGILISNIETVELLNGRFTLYSSAFFGGGLLWDNDYSYAIQEIDG